MARLLICLTLLSTLTPSALPEATTSLNDAQPTSLPSPDAVDARPDALDAPDGRDAPDASPAEARADTLPTDDGEPPEGYYAFVESPNATPPRVRPPPYRQVASECPEANDARPHVTANNLCGDLNRGVIPRNPMGQNPAGEPYPFELIRNQTLRFLSKTLPVLRADDTLPRVAHLAHPPAASQSASYPPPAPSVSNVYSTPLEGELLPEADPSNRLEDRLGRSRRSSELPAHALRMEHRSLTSDDIRSQSARGDAAMDGETEAPRESRKFCDGGGVFCMLYRAINGDSSSAGVERREDPGPQPHPHAPHQHHPRYEGPPTPCPARVEYATPVFARNYQGVWRYVVQIPYEGYFTQTVEVTRCMQSRCHYLEGGCLSSPRWVSLLVAELHYPQEYQQQQFLQQRSSNGGAGVGGASAGAGGDDVSDKPPHCDGHDELGCFQVRLYYDWFLVPGSCKCWRPDYFARYVRRRHSTNEL